MTLAQSSPRMVEQENRPSISDRITCTIEVACAKALTKQVTEGIEGHLFRGLLRESRLNEMWQEVSITKVNSPWRMIINNCTNVKDSFALAVDISGIFFL